MPLPNLPENKDEEFWGDAEKHQNISVPLHICETHTKERFMEHTGYKLNADGTVACKFCPYGGYLPGYLKVKDGRLIDLRTLKGE